MNELEEGQQPISSSLNLLSGFRVVPDGTCADILRIFSLVQSDEEKEGGGGGIATIPSF